MTHCRSGGFILPMVLILAVFVALSVGIVAGRGLDAVVASRMELEELQRRWGELSCRTVVLPDAERILRAREASSLISAPVARCEFRLGEMEFGLYLWDEQAKVNINKLFQADDRAAMQSDAMLLLGQVVAVDDVRFPDVRRSSDGGSRSLSVISFDQFLPGVTPAQLLGRNGAGEMPGDGVAALVTCWTDGRVNHRRARPEVLLAQLSRPLGTSDAHQAVELIQAEPGISVSAIADRLQLDPHRRSILTELLTETSQCHSMWLVHHGARRSWHHMSVSRSNGDDRRMESGGKARTVFFEW